MLKPIIIPVLAATALLAIAGSSFVYAQQGFGDHGNGGPGGGFRHQRGAADIAAFGDARIAAVKAGLELTPDQAKNWPPFEQAVRDMVQLRIERVKARQAGEQQAPASPFDRLGRRADAMAKTSAALKKVADAGAPLYASLDDQQKGRFMALAHLLRPHHHGEGDGQGWGHRGFRFGQNDDQGPGGRMHRMMGEGGDQDSHL